MTTVPTRSFSPSSRSRRWQRSTHSQPSSQPSSPPQPEPTRSYHAYLQRIRESRPYWFLLEHLIYGTHRSPSTQPSNPIFILEVAADGSQRHFSYKTYEELQTHLKTPYVHDGYGLMNTSSCGRRVILVTDMPATVLEVLGDAYGMDFGFFADHLLPDEHVSYTAKTTRGSHCHVLEEGSPAGKRFQFEYRELSRSGKGAESPRSVCRVFERASGMVNWDAIFQRRFSVYESTPSNGGLVTDIYLFDEHAFRGPFALGISRLDLPSFTDFKNGNTEAFGRSLGIYPEDGNQHARDIARHDPSRSPLQDELIHFIKSPSFDPARAFESHTYILARTLQLTLVMWRHLLVKLEHTFLTAIENRDMHDGSLSAVSAELSRCAYLVVRKTIPTIRALCKDATETRNLSRVLGEFEALAGDLEHVAARAEKTHAVVLAKVSILESKKAIEHSVRGIELAKRVGRLTKLAFVFIPLSFVTSFLGMMQFDGNFSAQTNRVIWIFFAMAMPLVLITVFLAVPDRIGSVVTRSVYLMRRRLGIGWVWEKANVKYYVRRGNAWEEYYRWLCEIGWERKEGVGPKTLVVMWDDMDGGTQRVGLALGTWLHLKHAWRNVR